MENQEKVHKRRVRYSGTHPKSYKEKYKEHNPEKYADTIAKVIQKGSTPAGMHISIMVQEILDFLQIKPGMTGLDATLGYGGHTKAMLQKLEGNGHIYALDVDPIESAKTKERLASQGFGEEILTVRLQNFADIDQVVKDDSRRSPGRRRARHFPLPRRLRQSASPWRETGSQARPGSHNSPNRRRLSGWPSVPSGRHRPAGQRRQN